MEVKTSQDRRNLNMRRDLVDRCDARLLEMRGTVHVSRTRFVQIALERIMQLPDDELAAAISEGAD
jgi:hypothetical protein